MLSFKIINVIMSQYWMEKRPLGHRITLILLTNNEIEVNILF